MPKHGEILSMTRHQAIKLVAPVLAKTRSVWCAAVDLQVTSRYCSRCGIVELRGLEGGVRCPKCKHRWCKIKHLVLRSEKDVAMPTRKEIMDSLAKGNQRQKSKASGNRRGGTRLPRPSSGVCDLPASNGEKPIAITCQMC